MLRFLVEGKLLGGRARGQILTSKDQYEVGDTVVLTVRALDEGFGPLLMPELPLRVAPVDGRLASSKGEAPSAETVSVLTSAFGATRQRPTDRARQCAVPRCA